MSERLHQNTDQNALTRILGICIGPDEAQMPDLVDKLREFSPSQLTAALEFLTRPLPPTEQPSVVTTLQLDAKNPIAGRARVIDRRLFTSPLLQNGRLNEIVAAIRNLIADKLATID